MNELYPLKFKPQFLEKIWGGKQVKDLLGLDYGDLSNCGEVWLVSGLEDRPSVVANGFLAGNELPELLEVYMGDLMGEVLYEKFGTSFPLLVKIIDAADWLSIQVHPDDTLAHSRGLSNGKTEMWYILGAAPGAELISGFNQKLEPQQYIDALHSGKLSTLLNRESVSAGDVFYMPAGRVHAIGPGTLLAEIQQSSDTTYRIYDWDRKDAQGNGRALHTAEALEAIDFSLPDKYRTDYRPVENGTATVVDEPSFVTNLVSFSQPLDKNLEMMDSFVIYLSALGNCRIEGAGESVMLNPGEAVLIPAILDRIYLIPESPEVKLLETYVV